MSRNVKVVWNGPEVGKRWHEKYDPNFGKSILGSVALKLEYFDISIHPPGLLSRDKEETATVYISFSYKHPDTDVEAKAVKQVSGKSGEVYAYCLETINASRDLFISTWNIQKDRCYKSMTGIPFRSASSGEKLMTKVTEAGMTPRKFAEKVKKDYSNFFRELKGQTKLTLKQALEYSKELDCDPVELLFEDLRCMVWGTVDLYNSNPLGNETFDPCQIFPGDVDSVVVPRNIYTPNLKAIKINSEGSHLHNHYAFYRKSDTDNHAFHGRLVVAGTTDDRLADIGYEPTSFWFGIYDVQRGGKQLLLNPDPYAEKKEVVKGPFSFVAPVIATMHPSSLRRDYNYYEMNRKALEYFKLQEAQKRLQEDKLHKYELELKKVKDEMEKYMQKDLEERIKKQQDLYLKQVEELHQDVKKRA
tara:strand:+ start:2812 stop:4062 length:1251 start_codon:yes stop_codon:yes gene_type:complete